MELCVGLAIYFGCVYAASAVGSGLGHRKVIKILFLPGVVLHAAGRAVGCLCSMSSIDKIEFIEDRRPFLTPGPSRIPYLGQLFSAFATHLPIMVVYVYLHSYLPIAHGEELCLPPFEAIRSDPHLIMEYARTCAANLEPSPAAFAITCYLFVGLALSYDLRLTEFMATTIVALAGCWVCGVLSWLGLGFSFLSRGWFLTHYYVPEWWGIASSFLVLTALSSLLVILLRTGRLLTRSPLVPGRARRRGRTRQRSRDAVPA